MSCHYCWISTLVFCYQRLPETYVWMAFRNGLLWLATFLLRFFGMTALANLSTAYANISGATLNPLEGILPRVQENFPGKESLPQSCPTLNSLHLINGEHFSGAERVQQILGRCLPKFGVGAKFVCIKPGKFPELSGLQPDQVCSIAMKNRYDLSVLGRIAAHAINTNAHVLHAHTPRTAMIAGLVARKTKLPWIYHVHSPTARDSTRIALNRINDCIEAFSLRYADKIITVSKSLRREMLSRGFARQKVTAIANGVAQQSPIDAMQRLSETHWRLGMVALIRPRKGIEVLLEAIANLGIKRDRITLEVIGGFETAEYESSVRSLVQRLGIQEIVHFRGFTQDVPAVMRTLDAMVLPSLFGEGMPMVVLEALACGVPVIATRVEGTPEVVRDGKEGILANPQDAVSLSHAIRDLMESRTVWCTMSRMAFERHRTGFSDFNMAQKTALVYRQLTGLV
jgi:glycosyltransferase involved in cell wall biosynthesis